MRGRKALLALGGAMTFLVVLGAAASCSGPGGVVGSMALATAPKKPSKLSPRPEAAEAKALFWQVFQAGDFDRRLEVLNFLTAEYIACPFDGELALLIAHSHLWAISERARSAEAESNALIIDELTLARFYFDQAATLMPEDRRIPGWQGSVEMAMGTIHREQVLVRRGYYRCRDAWREYPEFNGFTFAFAMAGTDPSSAEFAEAREALWSTARACSDGRVTQKQPNAAGSLEAVAKQDPVCWNTARAPHNWEGFWWTAAQFEAAVGDSGRAKICFSNARLSPTYTTWPSRERFEEQEGALSTLGERLATDPNSLLVNSAHACVSCHAQ